MSRKENEKLYKKNQISYLIEFDEGSSNMSLGPPSGKYF